MSSRPIHKNLDTSFINLSELVKYLRKRQFVGRVSIQLNGYQADIQLKDGDQISVREHDQISGLISNGKEAMQRILIRAREPGGSVSVYQNTSVRKQTNKKVPKKPAAKPRPRTQVQSEIVKADIADAPIPKPVDTRFQVDFPANRQGNGNTNGYSNGYSSDQGAAPNPPMENPPETEFVPEDDRQTSLPDFPFDLTNSVEKRAQNQEIAAAEWQNLLRLTVELLGVVDRTLANHRLDFTAAYRKARAEIARDYPFMNPSSKIFDYQKGRITMNKQVNNTVFVNSIAESLGRIVQRLGQNPKFSLIYRETSHLIIALINKRKEQYDRFGLTKPLERILSY